MKRLPISQTSNIITATVTVGVLVIISLMFLPKKATAPVAGFRDCVRKTKSIHASAAGGARVCRLPDGTEAIERAGGESDFPISLFQTANDMISGSNEKEDVLITTQEEFDTVWQQLFGQMDPSQAPPKPEMDAEYFDRSTVIAVFAGQKSSGGYSIEPLLVWEEADRIEIVVQETAPRGNALTVITTPYSIFSIPNRQKPIVFLHVTDGMQSKQPAPETRF